MINIGFRIIGNDDWIAGTNYLRNLFMAIAQLNPRKINPILIIGKKVDRNITSRLENTTKIISTSMLDRMSFPWLVQKTSEEFFGCNVFFKKLLERNNITVLSHASMTRNSLPESCKVINWIADFQHVDLPEMFSREERDHRSRQTEIIMRESDTILVSSYNARGMAETLYPQYKNKIKVLRFVYSIDGNVYQYNNINEIKEKYRLKGKYFFIPNQFWQHKNHITVFKAVKILKDKNKDVLIVCSGLKSDYRKIDHISRLESFILDNRLQENIKILGLINYEEVLHLMRHCISLINPSIYEGWSSTVEEAKSLGKNLILSDIPVHREQNASECIYFNTDDPDELAEILWGKWNSSDGGPDYKLEKDAIENIRRRVNSFAEEYQDIVLSTL